jgi:hypothetical protein
VVVRSKASVCGRSIAGIAGSSLTEGTDVRFLCLLCVVQLAASATSWTLMQRSSIGCVSNYVWYTALKKLSDLGPILAVASQQKCHQICNETERQHTVPKVFSTKLNRILTRDVTANVQKGKNFCHILPTAYSRGRETRSKTVRQ